MDLNAQVIAFTCRKVKREPLFGKNYGFAKFMSKLSPLGQSMASLFTPESERIRSGQAKAQGGSNPSGSTISAPGAQKIEGQKTEDSLSNPNSPGYEPWGRRKKGNVGADSENQEKKSASGLKVKAPSEGPEIIRLSLGWERILMAQRKLCEKAKNILLLLEGPDKYRAQKKNKGIMNKSRGCIVDLDTQKTQAQKEAKERDEGKESA